MDGATYYRPDIEGLRAIAVLAVLLFHAGLPLPGGFVGVDVFFVISGFLITSLLLREAERTGTISFLQFYARRAKRLLPASSLVLLTAAVLLVRFAPETDVPAFALDLVAAAAYLVNWRFADRSVDYLAEDTGRSPILHFWSLAVEEQFYFIWPVVIVIALRVTRRLPGPKTGGLAVALSAILLPSLAWSLYYTSKNPSAAFFVTTTRLWELAIGAMTALFAPRVSDYPPRPAMISSWLGLAMVLGSTCVFDGGTNWPSYRALVPTLGTALLILGGSTRARSSVTRWLALPPLVWIGGLSYSLYLWHWPLVVLGQDWLRLSGPGWGTAIVSASVLPAWLSHRFVERPARFSKTLSEQPGTSLSVGLNLSLAAIVAGGIVYVLQSKGEPQESSGERVELLIGRREVTAKPDGLGAGALTRPTSHDPTADDPGWESGKAFFPAPDLATKDLPRSYDLGCQTRFKETKPKWCEIGDLSSNKVAVVVGDSKILQYFEALDAAGQALGWRIRAATKSSCPFSEAEKAIRGRPYSECTELNRLLMEEFQRHPPAAIITSQTARTGSLPRDDTRGRTTEKTDREPSQDDMVEGLRRHWQALVDLGTQVIVVLDNPHPQKGRVYECVSRHESQPSRCTFSLGAGRRDSAAPAQLAAAALVPGVRVIDLTDEICPNETCPPIIGGVLVYRQGSHITNTYARTLAPELTRQLEPLLR